MIEKVANRARCARCVVRISAWKQYASADSPATYLYLPITPIQQVRAMARAGGSFYEDMYLRLLGSELPEEVDAALDFENENLTDLNLRRGGGT